MREIVVLSGKGGTGKTSILASFAHLQGQSIIVDCDVDAPNLHLIVGGTKLMQAPFSSSCVATIDMDACRRCGRCAAVCRFDAIHLDEKKLPQFDPRSCEGCGVCSWNCPAKAIAMVPRTSGRWYISRTEQGTMFHALLEPGEENSGKLVSLLKEKARSWASKEGVDILIDGPPGIGCAAIAALSGASLAVLVAEPTCSGLSDLTRAIGLVRRMRVPLVVLINRCDLSPELTQKIEEEMGAEGIPVVGKVPFDEAVWRCMAKGLPVVVEDSPASRAVREGWEKLVQLAPP